MSKKLQNIKAIQQMLDGSHKFQTKKTIGFSDAKDVAKQKYYCIHMNYNFHKIKSE
jgi:hypothetical protein